MRMGISFLMSMVRGLFGGNVPEGGCAERGVFTPCCFEKKMVRPAGFEPATYGFEVRNSIQLSYRRILKFGVSDGI